MDNFKAFVEDYITLDEQEWQLFKKILHQGHYKKDELILGIGEFCTSLLFINKGCVRIFSYKKENEETYDFVFENDFAVDYRSFLTEQPSTVGMIALEDLDCIRISKTELTQLNAISNKIQEFARLMTELVYIYLDERLQSIFV